MSTEADEVTMVANPYRAALVATRQTCDVTGGRDRHGAGRRASRAGGRVLAEHHVHHVRLGAGHPPHDLGQRGDQCDATVSIEIAGFENLVSAVATVRTELPGDRGQVSSALAGVVLSTDSLTPVESVLGWADDEIRGLQRRLALAKVIEASTPGQQFYVQFDESQISTKSDEEIAADVETIQEWVEDGGGEIPDDVLQILQESAADPYFARALAGAVSVEDLSLAVLNAGHHRETIMRDATYSYDEDPLAAVEAYDARYELFLDSLGTSMGVASQGTGDLPRRTVSPTSGSRASLATA